MDRLERLVNLVAALLEANQPLTRHDLRTRVGGYSDDDEAFRRNFERDKDLLRQMGMPLVIEPVDARRPEGPQGYRIPRDRYELPDPGLAPDELAALHLAASTIAMEGAWGHSASTTALWKLAGSSSAPDAGANEAGRAPDPAAPAPDRLAPDRLAPDQALAELPGGERVAVLFGAVAARQRVRLTYRGEGRDVDPWRLSYRNGQWYLAGFDHRRGEARTYRLDRMEAAPSVVGEPGAFARPAGAGGPPPPPWLLGDEHEIVAELLVDAIQAEWAVATVGEAAVLERRADGGVVLQVAVTNRDAFRSFVLGFLDHAEVLGPPVLRRQLVDWLQTLAPSGAQVHG